MANRQLTLVASYWFACTILGACTTADDDVQTNGPSSMDAAQVDTGISAEASAVEPDATLDTGASAEASAPENDTGPSVDADSVVAPDGMADAAALAEAGVADAGTTADAGAFDAGPSLCALNGNSIGFFSESQSGDVAPFRAIAGNATGFQTPSGIASDLVNDEVWVSNQGGGSGGNGSLTAYPMSATGNVAPLRTIAGATTGIMSQVRGVAVDPVAGEVFALSYDPPVVTVYDRTANGDVAPKRSFGSFTTPTVALAIDVVNHEAYVVTRDGQNSTASITVWDTASTSTSAVLRTIVLSPPVASLGTPIVTGVAIDPVNNEIFVAVNPTTAIVVYDRLATGSNPTVIRQITSSDLSQASGLVFDTTTNVLAVSQLYSSQGAALSLYPRTWSGTTVTPLSVISGSSTQLSGPVGVALCQ